MIDLLHYLQSDPQAKKIISTMQSNLNLIDISFILIWSHLVLLYHENANALRGKMSVKKKKFCSLFFAHYCLNFFFFDKFWGHWNLSIITKFFFKYFFQMPHFNEKIIIEKKEWWGDDALAILLHLHKTFFLWEKIDLKHPEGFKSWLVFFL